MFFDTIIAEFTAPGKGAVSGIRISGTDAKLISEDLLGLTFKEPRKVYYTKTDYDNILVVWYKAPNSYTGEDVVELFCHANDEIVKNFIEQYVKRGVRPAEAGEFTKRAFLNARLDLMEAESVLNIVNAGSLEAVKAAKTVLDGELSLVLSRLRDKLLKLQENFEYEIDFNEDEANYINSKLVKDLEQYENSLYRLVSRLKTNNIFENTRQIVFVGETNVGKSSLFNTLLGYARSIVSETHGTTRDYISEHLFIDNYKVVLTDTAGIRKTNEDIEQEGIARTEKLIESEAIKILIVDTDYLPKHTKSYDILVRNKSDLLPKNYERKQEYIYTSTKTGEGVKDLLDKLKELIRERVKTGENTFLVSNRVFVGVESIYRLVKELGTMIKAKTKLDILASYNINILDEIDRLFGKNLDRTELINSVFENFCVGK